MSSDVIVGKAKTGSRRAEQLPLRSVKSSPSTPSQTNASTPRSPAADSSTGGVDWDANKTRIERLYVQENLPLREVMRIMQTQHFFKATQRMYKRQFIKWHWFKYDSLGRHRDGSPDLLSSSSGTKTCRRRTRPSVSISPSPGAATTLQHENDGSARFQASLLAIQNFLVGFAEKTDLRNKVSKFNLMQGYDSSLPNRFWTAFVYLKSSEKEMGGQLLRFAFLCLEERIRSLDHTGHYFDLFIWIPHLFVSEGMLNLLGFYLRFIKDFADACLGREHPVDRTASSLLAMSHWPLEEAQHYLGVSSQVWSDTYRDVRGDTTNDLTVLVAWRDHLRINGPGNRKEVTGFITEFNRLRKESDSLHGVDSSEARFLENDLLVFYQQFPPDAGAEPSFIQQSQRFVDKIANKYAISGTPMEEWDSVDKNLYSDGYGRMSDFCFINGDYENGLAHSARHLANQGRPKYLARSLQTETRLREIGRVHEARELERRRLSSQARKDILQTIATSEAEFWRRFPRANTST